MESSRRGPLQHRGRIFVLVFLALVSTACWPSLGQVRTAEMAENRTAVAVVMETGKTLLHVLDARGDWKTFEIIR